MAAANSGSVGRGRAFVAPSHVRAENTQAQKSVVSAVAHGQDTTPIARRRQA